MANAKIDSVKLSGGSDTYYFDLPSDATPNITSLTTGTLTVSGTSNLTDVSVSTINGVTVPSSPKFTDTTYTFTSNNPTLTWGTTSEIGTAGGTTYKVTMPAKPYDISLSGTTLTITQS